MGTLLVMIAALCWGISGGIGGILMSNGWDAFVVSLYRGGIGLVFVSVWLFLRPYGSGLKCCRLYIWSIVAGLGVAGNFAFYFISITKGGVSVASTLMYCAPVFVYLVSFAFRFERPTPSKFAVLAFVMFGIVLLTRIYKQGPNSITLIAIVTGLFSGLSYAVFIFAFKNAASYGSPQAILVIAFSVLVLVLSWASGGTQVIAVLKSPSLPLFAALGILGAGISFIMYIIGLNYTVPAAAFVVAMVEPVTASLFGVFILHENLTVLQIIGIVIILVPVTFLCFHMNDQSL